MKLKGQLQWTDYLNSQLLHIQQNRVVRFMLYGVYLFFVVAFVSGIYFIVTGQSDIQLSEIVPIFIILAIFPLYRYVILPNRIKKLFAQQKELQSPIEIEFTDTDVIFSNEFGNVTRPWNHFTKWKVNNELILLYHSDIIYNTLPKRIFTEPQQIEVVKSYIKKNKVPVAKSRSMISCIIYVVGFIAIVWMMYIGYRNTAYP